PDLFLIVCMVGAIATGPLMISADGDPARHLLLGRYMLSEHQVLLTNVFTYPSQGVELPPYEWLARIISAAVYELAGLGGVVLLYGLVIGLAFMAVLQHILASGRSARIARWVAA